MAERQDMIYGLRELADFLEGNPEVPVPYDVEVNVWLTTREEMAAVARVGGTWEKIFSFNYFMLKKAFGNGAVSFEVNTNREQVCRKIVTGTEVIPAQPEREVEKFEWVCDEPLLAAQEERV